MSDDIKVTVISSSLILGIAVFFVYINFFNTERVNNPRYTVATLSAYTFSGGKGIQRGMYEYAVNDSILSVEGYYNTTLILGEKFKAEYEQDNPSIVKIMSYEPVFLSDEDTVSTIGNVKEVGRGFSSFVAYDYHVGGFIYSKVQDVHPDFDLSDIKEGDSFEVTSLKENPYRSRINLHKPILKQN